MKALSEGDTSRQDLQACLVMAALATLFFGEALVSPNAVLYSSFSDIIQPRMAWQEHLRRCLLNGSGIPLWYPTIFAGIPFVGNPECWAFYPVNWLFIWLPANVSILLMVVSHTALGGIGYYVFLRFGREISTWPALMGGICFMFGGKYLLHVLIAGHTGFLGVAWVPWCLWMIDLICKDGKRRHAGLLAVFLGMMGLSMQPQISFYSAFFMGGYFLLRIGKCDHRKRAVLLFLSSTVLAAGISSVQLLPAAEMATLSARKAFAETSFTSVGALGFRDLMKFIQPSIRPEAHPMSYWAGDTWAWEKAYFLGLLPLFCACCCLADRTRKRDHVFLLLSIAISVGYSLGERAIFFTIVNHLPGFSLFRVAGRSLFVLGLTVPIVVAYGLHQLVISTRRSNIALAGTFVAAIVARLSVGASDLLLVIPALLYGAGLLVFKTKESGERCDSAESAHRSSRFRAVAPALVTFAFLVESWCFLYPHIQLPLVNDVYRSPLIDRLPESLLKTGRIAEYDRQIVMTALPEFLLVRRGLKDINGYNPMLSADYVSYLSRVTGKPPKPEVWIPDLKPTANQPLLDHLGLAIRYRETPEGIAPFRVDSALPQVYLVPNSVTVSDPDDALQLLDSDRHNPRHHVILHTDATRIEHGEPYRPVEVQSYLPDRIVIDVSLQSPAWMVMNEAWHPGWTCKESDGTTHRVYRANFLFRAVKLNSGNHVLTFKFEPMSYRIGKWASLMSLLAALCLIAWRQQGHDAANS